MDEELEPIMAYVETSMQEIIEASQKLRTAIDENGLFPNDINKRLYKVV